MKITDVLVAEHTIFLGIFDQIERLLRQTSTAAGVRTLADLVHGMLERHAHTETDLAYLALDHVLADRGQLEQLHQEHEEIDSSLRNAMMAGNFAAARRALQAALARARSHFAYEECSVFPLLEKALQPATLEMLGKSWERMAPDSTADQDHALAVGVS